MLMTVPSITDPATVTPYPQTAFYPNLSVDLGFAILLPSVVFILNIDLRNIQMQICSWHAQSVDDCFH